MISTEAIDRYGLDGVYTSGFAWMPGIEEYVHLAWLECEQRRRAGIVTPASPEARLWWLTFAKWYRAYAADVARQRAAAEALNIAWPPEGPAFGWRPWVWPHEQQSNPAVPLPVVYPPDWCADELHPDRYGFGSRWKPGEVLVIGVDELVVEGEVLEPEPERPRPRSRPRARALPDGIPDAEVVEAQLRSRSTPALGAGRVIGTWSREGGFAPTLPGPLGGGW